MGAAKTDLDSLSAAAELVRDSLKRSQVVTDSMVGILGSFDRRLSSLETAMRPTQVRTHAFRVAHQNIEKTLAAAESILSQFDVSRKVEARIARGPREDLISYLAAVDQLHQNVEYFSYNRSFKSSDGALSHARSLLSTAMDKLGEEFRSLIVQHSKSEDPAKLSELLPKPQASGHANENSTELTSPRETSVLLPLVLLPPEIIPKLQEMARRLIAAAHNQQCVKIYSEIRASVLEQTLRKLGFEKLTKDDVQKLQWEILEGKIGSWIQDMRFAVKLLYMAECELCNEVFRSMDPYRGQCFAEVTTNSFSNLLSTGDAIARSKKSPEKLFVLLDMYETMHDLLPEIQVIFDGSESSGVLQAAISLSQKLAQTAKETFDDFLEAVEKDATKSPVQDGTVHPLTSYVINYVKFLFDYQTTLKQLFEDGDHEDKSNSYLAKSTAKIMQVLLSNLEGKAKQYKDPALTHIFLMNNIHYIVRSVRRSEAKDLLGDDWIQRHRRMVQQHAQMYQRTAWGKVLLCLSGQGLSSSSGGSGHGSDSNSSGISRNVLKERFRTFNTLFEEVHQKQSQWTIPEVELRDAVRLAVAEVLLPAYRSFLRRYNAILENSKNPQKYVKYTPEDLDQLLGEFFESKKVEQKR